MVFNWDKYTLVIYGISWKRIVNIL